MSRPAALAALLAVAFMAALACTGSGEMPQPAPAATIKLTSAAFADGVEIPVQYTCDGRDVSPGLSWSGVPAGTASLALIMDDPDAPGGDWVHWVLYAITPGVAALPEAIVPEREVPAIGRHGTNDFRRPGYGGPCPPRGGPHRYFFKLYALDFMPTLASGATKKQLLNAMSGHVLAEGRLMGTYKRR